RLSTVFLADNAKTLIRENDSPDVGFRFSINAYRGCEHGCVYCYARPGHETLGLNAGIDFETNVLVKPDAVALLKKELNSRGWRAVRELSAAGVPVRAMLAPLIPGLTDCEVPAILQAAKEAGARAASFVMLRLPFAVAPIFMNWLKEHRPLAAERVESLIRQM